MVITVGFGMNWGPEVRSKKSSRAMFSPVMDRRIILMLTLVGVQGWKVVLGAF